MRNRFAFVTPDTAERFRTERNLLMARARAGYDGHSLDARAVVELVDAAREQHRKLMWSLRQLAKRQH